MKRPATPPAKAPTKPIEKSVPVQLRVRSDKLKNLDAIVDRKGTNRAALIQIAIAEYIERNQK